MLNWIYLFAAVEFGWIPLLKYERHFSSEYNMIKLKQNAIVGIRSTKEFWDVIFLSSLSVIYRMNSCVLSSKERDICLYYGRQKFRRKNCKSAKALWALYNNTELQYNIVYAILLLKNNNMHFHRIFKILFLFFSFTYTVLE